MVASRLAAVVVSLKVVGRRRAVLIVLLAKLCGKVALGRRFCAWWLDFLRWR